MFGGMGALVAACSSENGDPDIRVVPGQREPGDHEEAATEPTPEPTPEPEDPTTVLQEGEWGGTHQEELLLPGTAWETGLIVRDSGISGPVVLVLGGVHGNEPGSWLGAEQMTAWEPARGTLLVAPYVNVHAIDAFERTLEELGDMNRLYPGDHASDLPMEQMAAEVLDVARAWEVDLLLDLHESWGFYAEYPDNAGYYAIGQTVTTGKGPLSPGFGESLANRVNQQFTEREQMIIRDGEHYRAPRVFDFNHPMSGRSSLAAGGYVGGLTPVLIEMGQENQPVERRTALQLRITRAALDMLEMA